VFVQVGAHDSIGARGIQLNAHYCDPRWIVDFIEDKPTRFAWCRVDERQQAKDFPLVMNGQKRSFYKVVTIEITSDPRATVLTFITPTILEFFVGWTAPA